MILTCIIVVLVVINSYLLIAIDKDMKEYQDAVVEYEEIAQQNITEIKATKPEETYSELEVNHDNLASINPDYIGWLYFPYLEISYPIVQETTVNEYLRTTFYGEHNSSGSIFMDLYSSKDFSGYHNVLFGHNMKNNTMFGKFKELYRNEDTDITSNPYVYIYTKDGVLKYKIFAYYQTVYNSDSYKLVNDLYEYEHFVNYIKMQDTIYFDDTVGFFDNTSILTLSTCSGKSGGDTRFVIHCIRE